MKYIQLQEIDSLHVFSIVNNEVDPFSSHAGDFNERKHRLAKILLHPSKFHKLQYEPEPYRDGDTLQRAQGFSLLIRAVHGNTRHWLLLDIGSDEISWAHNMHCLELDAASIEHIILSHWDLRTSDAARKVVRRISEVREKPVTIDIPLYTQAHGNNEGTYRDFHDAMGIKDLLNTAAGGRVMLESCDEYTIFDDKFLISSEQCQSKEKLQLPQEPLSCPKSQSKGKNFSGERFVTCKVKDKGLVVFFIGDYQNLIKVCNYALEITHGRVLYAVVGDFDVKNAGEDELNIFMEGLELLHPKATRDFFSLLLWYRIHLLNHARKSGLSNVLVELQYFRGRS